MQYKLFFRAKALLLSLCLAIPVFLGQNAAAQDMQSFVTIKLGTPETLLQSAEKFADLAGQSEQFAASKPLVEDTTGINMNGTIGIVVRTDGNTFQDAVGILPIEDINAVTNMLFVTQVKPMLEPTGTENVYRLATPAGQNLRVEQKNGYVVVSLETFAVPQLDEPEKLFAGMEKYLLAAQVNIDAISLETVQGYLGLFQMMMAMQGGPEAAKALEDFPAEMERLYKEILSFTIGFAFDPKTADMEIGTFIVGRAGSDMEKQIAETAKAQSIFAGFRGGESAIFYSHSCVYVPASSTTQVDMQLALLAEGLLEQAKNEVDDEEYQEIEKIAESGKAALSGLFTEGFMDGALAMNGDGVVLGALTANNTELFKVFAANIIDYVKAHAQEHDGQELIDLVKNHVSQNYDTVEGFKLSKLVFKLSEAGIPEDEIDPALRDKSVALYWAVKENQAVAFAAGLDMGTTVETAFKAALSETKTQKPVAQPQFRFALKPLGAFLKTLGVAQNEPAVVAAFDILSKAGSDEGITASQDFTAKGQAVSLKMSGKTLETIIKCFKSSAASTEIRDF